MRASGFRFGRSAPWPIPFTFMSEPSPSPDQPAPRYTAALAKRSSPVGRTAGHAMPSSRPTLGDLSEGFDKVADLPKRYCWTCSRTPRCRVARRPSAGLHRDRHHRPLHADAGRNVVHPMGCDASGLPAEQYAVQTTRTRARRARLPSTRSVASSSASASATTGAARSRRSIPSYTTAGRSGSGSRRTTRGTTRSRTLCDPSPSSCASSRTGWRSSARRASWSVEGLAGTHEILGGDPVGALKWHELSRPAISASSSMAIAWRTSPSRR